MNVPAVNQLCLDRAMGTHTRRHCRPFWAAVAIGAGRVGDQRMGPGPAAGEYQAGGNAARRKPAGNGGEWRGDCSCGAKPTTKSHISGQIFPETDFFYDFLIFLLGKKNVGKSGI